MQQTIIKPIGKGQITIPLTWRKTLGITKGTFIFAKLMDNGIFIQNSNIQLENNNKFDEKVFDEAIKESFLELSENGKLDKLSQILNQRY